MNSPKRNTPSLYQGHLTRGERQRFSGYSAAALDHEIALLRILNERWMARLAEAQSPEDQAYLAQSLSRTALMIARLMQIRAGLGQGSHEARLDEIAASLRSAFTRREPPDQAS